MKFETVESLRAKLTARADLVKEIARCEARQTLNASELANLRDHGNLEDDAVVAEITRRRTFAEIYPARILVLYNELAALDDALSAATNQFCNGTLCPRITAGWNAAQVVARKNLSELGLNPVAVEETIAGIPAVSDWHRLVMTLGSLRLDENGAVAYAEAALTLFSQSADLEKQPAA